MLLYSRVSAFYAKAMLQSFTLPSFAKINLYLRVLGKRRDGFHELCTVFQTVSLHDDLTFSDAERISLSCSDPQIPLDQRNLIIRAAQFLQKHFSVEKGARIYLEKRIPSPGGLGGGSSNAAAALLGLKKLWKIEIGHDELLQISEELGADVPFFLYGGTALGTGRGTEISPIEELTEKFLLIITPNVTVSTREAFAAMDAPSLTNEDSKRILQICRFEAESLDLRHAALRNDFESSVFAAEPEIRQVKKTLLELGAVNALMCGSGASVFGIFDTQETRQTALKALDKEINWRKFAVATISRDEYREALSIVN